MDVMYVPQPYDMVEKLNIVEGPELPEGGFVRSKGPVVMGTEVKAVVQVPRNVSAIERDIPRWDPMKEPFASWYGVFDSVATRLDDETKLSIFKRRLGHEQLLQLRLVLKRLPLAPFADIIRAFAEYFQDVDPRDWKMVLEELPPQGARESARELWQRLLRAVLPLLVEPDEKDLLRIFIGKLRPNPKAILRRRGSGGFPCRLSLKSVSTEVAAVVIEQGGSEVSLDGA